MPQCLDDPIGFRKNGQPFWGFAGAEGEDGGGTEDPDDGDDDGGDDSGGDGKPKTEVERLKAALAAERETNKALRTQYRPIRQAMQSAGVTDAEKLARLLAGGDKGASGKGGDQQVDVEKIRQEAKAEATREANVRIAQSRVEAKAAKLFQNPDDALKFIGDVSDFVDADGKINDKAIARDLATLLEDKPYLGIQQEKRQTSFDGGARKTATTAQSFDDLLRQQSRNKRGM